MMMVVVGGGAEMVAGSYLTGQCPGFEQMKVYFSKRVAHSDDTQYHLFFVLEDEYQKMICIPV